MKQNIEKITVSLPKETLRVADENRERFGFQSRSDFINAAIREYVSRDLLKEFSGELAGFYKKITHSEMKALEEHLSKLFYKTAVELTQMNLLMASAFELEDETVKALRGKVVKLISQTRGFIPLSAANKNRMDLTTETELNTAYTVP
jgi:metal-responsive CopG/Arc/MetJ family transcriptional regulator